NEFNEKLEFLREEWAEVDAEEFEYDEEYICPTCNQELPQEQIEEARAKAESQFNEQKANKLESIVAEANAVKERIEKTEDEIASMQRKIEKFNKELNKNKSEIKKLKAEIEELENNKTDITENKEYIEKLKE